MHPILRGAARLALLLACSCDRIGRAGTPEGVPPTSPFLVSAQYPYSIVRLSTGSSEDVRQARYVTTPQGLRIAVILRNYQQRIPGQCDLHRLLLLDPEQGATSAFDTAGEPFALVVAAGRKSWAAVELGAGGGAGYAPDSVRVLDLASPATAAAPAAGFWPLAADSTGGLLGLDIRGVRIAAGLPEVELDYSAGLRQAGGVATAGQRVGATVSPDNQTSVSWQVEADGRGGWTATYLVWANPEAKKPLAKWSEPFPGVAGLVPRVVWIDAGYLAWQSYAPMRGPGGQEHWLSRIVSGELSTGLQRVLADHLPRRASWAVDYAGVFYAVPSAEANGSASAWEAWVASANGLTKRLLWSGPALRVEVCDALDGQRVLLHRQFLAGAGAEPALRSELLEVTLQPPTGGSLTLGVEALPSVPEAAPVAEDAAAETAQAEAEGGALPDAEGEGGGESGSQAGGFIPDDPAPPTPPVAPPPDQPGAPPPIG